MLLVMFASIGTGEQELEKASGPFGHSRRQTARGGDER